MLPTEAAEKRNSNLEILIFFIGVFLFHCYQEFAYLPKAKLRINRLLAHALRYRQCQYNRFERLLNSVTLKLDNLFFLTF